MDRLAVFLVDDEPDFLIVFRLFLENAGLSVTGEERDPRRALEEWQASVRRPDVVVADYCMPVMTGVELAARMLAEQPDQCIVLLTAERVGRTLRHTAADAGIAAVLSKHDPAHLPGSLRRCYDQHGVLDRDG